MVSYFLLIIAFSVLVIALNEFPNALLRTELSDASSGLLLNHKIFRVAAPEWIYSFST